MKKSQLRKIIKESIKELMTEQQTVNDMHQSIQMEICDCQPSTASSCQTLAPNMNGNTVNRGWTCNGQMCQQSDIDNIFTYTGNLDSGNVDWTSITYKLTGISQPAPISYNPPFDMVSSSCKTNPTGGCDPSAWSNHANWTSTFTNTVANHNNPCNFLNNKIAQFTNQIPNVGPVWANQLQCKLDLCNQLHSSNNC